MRSSVAAAAVFLCACGIAAGQQGVDQLLDRAVQAHGGAANLSRLKARHCQTRGQVIRGTPVPFTQEILAQAPKQIKEVMQFQVAGAPPGTVVTVLNGDSGRMEISGKSQPLDDNMIYELKEAAHLAQLVRLTELKNKEYRLTALGESAVSGRSAMGIRITSPGHRDVQLYFDREVGLLLKTERNVVDLRTKQLQREEALYSDWKVADGIVTPTKVTILRDGYKFSEVEVTAVRFLEKLDDDVFSQP